MKRALFLFCLGSFALAWAVFCPLGGIQVSWAGNVGGASGYQPMNQCIDNWNGYGPACQPGNANCNWAVIYDFNGTPSFVYCSTE